MTGQQVDWATDFELFDPDYVRDPFPVWDELRTTCPIAHTERRGPTWLPTTYDDVVALARDIERFSSTKIAVIPPPETPDGGPGVPQFLVGLPPISADPPLHTWTRRLLLPWFSHRRVDDYEPRTRELCRRLLDGFGDRATVDAAAEYAQQIPVRVIAWTLGVPEELADDFVGWVRDALEFADDVERRRQGIQGLGHYLLATLEDRKVNPGSDLISALLAAYGDEPELTDAHVLGIAALTLVAGIDTTWSAIGAALWHFATHPEDLAQMVANPEMMDTAIEELLRAYSPVTMARVVTEDVEFSGCCMNAGDKVLMNFPAANRDPAAFEAPDEVRLDRADNRHLAFGVGIHRCAGSNLARMELRVALEEWLGHYPRFVLAEGAEVTWAGGQVRGPRVLPVVVTPHPVS